MREIKNKEAFDSFTDNWEDNQPEHYYILEDGWSACEDFYEPIIKDLQAKIAELEKEIERLKESLEQAELAIRSLQ